MKIIRSFERIKTLGLWILVVILALSLFRNLERARRVKKEVTLEREELSKIQADNEKLAAELLRAQSAEFLEKQVRDKLGLVKEGEVVVVLPDVEILRKLAPDTQVEAETLPDPTGGVG